MTTTEAPAFAESSFPAVAFQRAGSYCEAYFSEAGRAAASVDWLAVDRVAAILGQAYATGASVFSCGNGGSASIANHLQCDHVKGIRTGTDLRPRVVSLSSNVEILTAIANDICYDNIFTYQLESLARPGDVLIAISSSGRSRNIVQALAWAREHHLRTVALTGFRGGGAKEIAEAPVHVDCANYGIIEDTHQAIMHSIAQYLRQSRMSSDLVATTTF